MRRSDERYQRSRMTNGTEGYSGDWRFPLLLSCLAGASTCVGAAVVFLASPEKIEASMGFSLSLAASVMITVSAVSIGPECLEGTYAPGHLEAADGSWYLAQAADRTWYWGPWNLSLLLLRLAYFGLGCLGYYLLSKLLVSLPEPESFVAATASSRQLSMPGLSSPTKKLKVGDGEDNLEEGLQDLVEPIDEDHGLDEDDEDSEEEERRSLLFVPQLPTHHQRLSKRRDWSSNSTNHSTPSKNAKSHGSKHSEGSPCPSSPVARRTPVSVRGRRATSRGAKDEESQRRRKSWRVAMLLFVSLLCHNFPEGLAVVASTVESPELGVTVAFGILVHNIPEGIAIAVPCMAARPDAPWLAFWLASISGLAEPLGAAVALGVLRQASLPLENVLACVAGIMCTVAALELYPEAISHAARNRNPQSVAVGTVLGALLMLATEWYLPS